MIRISATKSCYLWEVISFRSHGPAYEEYPETFQCKWIFKFDSNYHPLKRYRGYGKNVVSLLHQTFNIYLLLESAI